MHLLNKLCTLITIALFASFTLAANELKVKVWSGPNCQSTALNTATVPDGHTKCLVKAAGFQSFKATTGSTIDPGYTCSLTAWSDTTCSSYGVGGTIQSYDTFPRECISIPGNTGPGGFTTAYSLNMECYQA